MNDVVQTISNAVGEINLAHLTVSAVLRLVITVAVGLIAIHLILKVLDRLLARENFAYSYTQDPLYRQYAQQYTQNAHNASADAAAQAAALTGGYGSSYAASAAQQAYQQQIGALNEAIPSLYSLALDTYTSGGDELVSRLDQLNAQEQSAQEQYDRQLSDYYTQLQQKGEDYNNAYAKDYGQYQDYLSRLDTLHGYYTAQEYVNCPDTPPVSFTSH